MNNKKLLFMFWRALPFFRIFSPRLSLSSNKCLFQSIQYQWFAKSKLGKLLLNITKINCLQCSYYIFIRIYLKFKMIFFSLWFRPVKCVVSSKQHWINQYWFVFFLYHWTRFKKIILLKFEILTSIAIA